MPQNARQKIDVAPVPKIGNCKGMPKPVRTATDSVYSELSAKLLKVAQEIADTQLCSPLRREGYEGVSIDSRPFQIPAKQNFSHFHANGDKPVLPAFSFHPNDKIIQIAIRLRCTKNP